MGDACLWKIDRKIIVNNVANKNSIKIKTQTPTITILLIPLPLLPLSSKKMSIIQTLFQKYQG